MTVKQFITKDLLIYLSEQAGHSHREIAEFFGVSRSCISHLTKQFGIIPELKTGRLGELKAIERLRSEGFAVKDMNEEDVSSPFDLLVNSEIRIEVKSCVYVERTKRYTFALSEKAENGCLEGAHRITLQNGRTRKRFGQTCDFILFVGFKEDDVTFWLMPSVVIADRVQTININPRNRHYAKYQDNFKALKKAASCANN